MKEIEKLVKQEKLAGYVENSAYTGENVDEVFQKAVRLSLQQIGVELVDEEEEEKHATSRRGSVAAMALQSISKEFNKPSDKKKKQKRCSQQ